MKRSKRNISRALTVSMGNLRSIQADIDFMGDQLNMRPDDVGAAAQILRRVRYDLLAVQALVLVRRKGTE